MERRGGLAWRDGHLEAALCVWGGGRDPAAAAGVGEATQAQRNRDRPGPVMQGKEGGDTDRDPLGGAAIGTRESHGGGGGAQCPASMQGLGTLEPWGFVS